MYDRGTGGSEPSRAIDTNEGLDESFVEPLRLGQDIRFVLVAVGGGATRVVHEVARRRLRYVETVAINCDKRVQGLDEFDRRVYLGPDSATDGDGGVSRVVGGILACAAAPALDRIFEGATFVTVVGSLGGGSGTGALPYVLEAAARRSVVLSAFVIKPFRCEGERREVADRAVARLQLVESFVEKQRARQASLQVLDNEALAGQGRGVPFARLNARWADLIADHIERSFVAPTESLVEAHRVAGLVDPEGLANLRTTELLVAASPGPMPPGLPSELPPLAPPTPAMGGPMAELTFEIELPMPESPLT